MMKKSCGSADFVFFKDLDYESAARVAPKIWTIYGAWL